MTERVAMYIDKKILSIIGLSVTACLLTLANFSGPAKADFAIKDPEYQLVTGHASTGGDDLFVLDNRLGIMAVFVYDPNRHNIFPRQFCALPDLFSNPMAPGR
jgi:hypothetical protein